MAIERAGSVLQAAQVKADTINADVDGVLRWSPDETALQLEVRLHLPPMPGRPESFCWDFVDLTGLQPAVVLLALAGACRRLEYRVGRLPPGDTPGPLDRYDPERFRTFHPYIDDAGAFMKALLTPQSEEEMNQGQTALTGKVVEASNRRLMALPRAEFDHEPPTAAVPMTRACSLANHALSFRAHGKQIFDLPPSLAASHQRMGGRTCYG